NAAFAAALGIAAFALQPAPIGAAEIAGRVLRFDGRLDAVIPPGAVLEKVLDGFTWVEGPLWNADEGYLLFSDIPHNRVIQWIPDRGWRVYLERSGYTGAAPFTGWEPGSNGLAYDREGRLVLCQHGNRRVVRVEKDGRVTPLAERYRGKRLNSPNDMTMDAEGNLYFTDPPFGLPRTFDDPAKELPFQGVYRLGPDGRLVLLTKELRAPNGIGLSPDGRTLYVTNTDPGRAVWMAYPITPGGTLGPGRVLLDASAQVHEFDMAGVRTSRPDGMKVDAAGNILGAGPGGLWIIAPDGTHLGTIAFSAPVSNCGFGGDGSTLYITVDTSVWRVPIRTGPAFDAARGALAAPKGAPSNDAPHGS
ncbi:MAG TPA: SMP-30/gluconolactonase/LRE family protein, partial [Candidatus Eisenbacteria bacterium]|nr:SMP-30/gluconolactonase/LRE family protein [Candidatus Eisenbacteria bacterium]